MPWGLRRCEISLLQDEADPSNSDEPGTCTVAGSLPSNFCMTIQSQYREEVERPRYDHEFAELVKALYLPEEFSIETLPCPRLGNFDGNFDVDEHLVKLLKQNTCDAV